jgi:hypothetical protein
VNVSTLYLARSRGLYRGITWHSSVSLARPLIEALILLREYLRVEADDCLPPLTEV